MRPLQVLSQVRSKTANAPEGSGTHPDDFTKITHEVCTELTHYYKHDGTGRDFNKEAAQRFYR